MLRLSWSIFVHAFGAYRFGHIQRRFSLLICFVKVHYFYFENEGVKFYTWVSHCWKEPKNCGKPGRIYRQKSGKGNLCLCEIHNLFYSSSLTATVLKNMKQTQVLFISLLVEATHPQLRF